MTFSYVISEAVTESLFKLKNRDRSFLLNSFHQIAANPSRQPDFLLRRVGDRELSVRAFDRWQITFWVDQWAKEVRIVEVRIVGRP